MTEVCIYDKLKFLSDFVDAVRRVLWRRNDCLAPNTRPRTAFGLQTKVDTGMSFSVYDGLIIAGIHSSVASESLILFLIGETMMFNAHTPTLQGTRVYYSPRRPLLNVLHQKRLLRHLRAATEEPFELKSSLAEEDGVDYYAVLGVSPNAEPAEIKKAYYKAMRDYHPDISLDEEATDFCIFLNDVYDTLMDPEKRAAYDEIAGFSLSAINPFFDNAYPEDQVFVDEFTCIGCKNCINVCPGTFGLEDTWGRARVYHQKSDSKQLVEEAIDTCPVSCIHWVTAPQLTLLETAMAKIERASAFLLLMGCARNVDVFQDAIRDFEKRQAAIRSRREAEQMSSWMVDLRYSWESATPEHERDLKKKAAAAQAASSARRWRDYQRNTREKDTLCLPSPSDE